MEIVRRSLLTSALLLVAHVAMAAEKPNILFILTDDLGYGDVGVFFQNERRAQHDHAQPSHLTPEIDALAAAGVQLRHYYCPAPVCAPSRASLLLGVHQGHANVRDNQFDKALEENHTLATVLRGAGYATAAIGKWGLQGGPDAKSPAGEKAGPAQWPGYPTRRGFDEYFGYVRHVDGHWHYPLEDKRQVWENEREISADLQGCYTTDLFTARAKKYITEHRAAHPEQPFFLYLAYDTPHAKLQLPPGPFPAGRGATGGLQWIGEKERMINTAGGTPDSYTHPDYAAATWDHDHDPATPEQPWPDVYRRYATDVRRIDDCVGDLLALLRDLKIDRDTLVVFTSDNGPSQESYLPQAYEPTFFHSFGPFDGIKRDTWEGGIRVGALACWPGQIPAGRVSEEPCQAHDWMATFAELAGVPAPARTDGVSLVPTLRASGVQKPSRVYVEYLLKGKTPSYAEFLPAHRGRARQQMQALRIGDFMGVRYDIREAGAPFEIYDIKHDPQEAHDLGQNTEFAALQQQMHDTVLRLRRPDPGAPRPYDDEPVPALPPAASKPGVRWRSYTAPMPWLARLDELTAQAHGSTSQIAAPAATADATALFFSGQIEAPAGGAYTFTLPAGAIALLRVHEATVIDCGFAPAASETSGTIRLAAGRHPFRLYWKTGVKPSLEWSVSGQPREAVPASALSLPLEDD